MVEVRGYGRSPPNKELPTLLLCELLLETLGGLLLELPELPELSGELLLELLSALPMPSFKLLLELLDELLAEAAAVPAPSAIAMLIAPAPATTRVNVVFLGTTIVHLVLLGTSVLVDHLPSCSVPTVLQASER